MLLAQYEFPHYSLFDASSRGLMVCMYSKASYPIRPSEEEVAKVEKEVSEYIKQLDNVTDVNLKVIISHNEGRYCTDDDSKDAIAYCMPIMKSGTKLTPFQAKGIVFLLSAYVEVLKPQNVQIVDINGQALFPTILTHQPLPHFTESHIRKNQWYILDDEQIAHEYTLTKKIQTMLDSLLGTGISKAIVVTEDSAYPYVNVLLNVDSQKFTTLNTELNIQEAIKHIDKNAQIGSVTLKNIFFPSDAKSVASFLKSETPVKKLNR